jgi:hypothetical protein
VTIVTDWVALLFYGKRLNWTAGGGRRLHVDTWTTVMVQESRTGLS